MSLKPVLHVSAVACEEVHYVYMYIYIYIYICVCIHCESLDIMWLEVSFIRPSESRVQYFASAVVAQERQLAEGRPQPRMKCNSLHELVTKDSRRSTLYAWGLWAMGNIQAPVFGATWRGCPLQRKRAPAHA